METTYDVRVWKIKVYEGKERKKSYYVRWKVAGSERSQPFGSAALADSFRSDIVAATRKGEAFDIETGLPISMKRAAHDLSWYELACAFVDMKWPMVAATTRRTHAEAMTSITTAMLTTDREKPDDRLIRKALCRWAFNTSLRDSKNCPAEIRKTLRWVENHTRSVSSFKKPEILRKVLNSLTVRLDGQPAAPSVINRRRRILNTAVEYAIERQILSVNPIPALKWKMPRTVHAIDRRAVINPKQARELLDAVRQQQRSGSRLVAFFGCLYYAGLRPEEAVSLRKHNLLLPADGWGELHLEIAEPYVGKEWTDSGRNRDRRQLKQRARGEGRIVPCDPELTTLLHEHIEEFGISSDGRIFRGERNNEEVPKLTIIRTWKRARESVFPLDVVASPLAKTPYDLRHAAVSTWLNAGVPPTRVAEWAGHSVEILLKIYAKCLDGETAHMHSRIDALRGRNVDLPVTRGTGTENGDSQEAAGEAF